MKAAAKALVLGLFAVLLLPGCGAMRRDKSEAPAELQDFNAAIAVERVWNTGVGRGMSRSLPRLGVFHDDDLLWTADYRGQVTAVDRHSGNRVSSLDTGLDISAGPSAYDGRLYVGTFDGRIHALNASDGSVRWSAQLSSEVLSLPTLHDGVLIVRCIDGRVFGLDPADGHRIWVHDRSVPALTLRGNSDVLVRAGQAYVGYDDGAVVALRVADGGVRWQQPVSVPEGRTELDRLSDINGAMAVIGGDLYAVTYRGRLASLTAEAGNIMWVKEVASSTGISVQRTQLALTDRDDNLWLVDRRNGTTLWRDESFLRRGLTRPAFQNDYVVVGDAQGYLHWMDTESGAIAARARPFKDRFATAPLVVGNTLYVLSSDGDLSAWRIRN